MWGFEEAIDDVVKVLHTNIYLIRNWWRKNKSELLAERI